MNNCFICAQKFSGCYVVDAKHSLLQISENKFILFFPKKNFFTCVPCGKELFKWNLSKNKLSLLKNRAYGKSIKLILAQKTIKKCIICKQVMQHLGPIGRCCSGAMYNVSTCGDIYY